MQGHLHSNDEILSVHAGLRQLDDATREIANKRVALFRRLDALQSKTSILQPEALSLIFQHAVGPSSFPIDKKSTERPLFPHSLGSISHAWRQVAWSTPQLWTTLALAISANNAERISKLLALYLSNARGLPVTLDIGFNWDFVINPSRSKNDSIAREFFKEENLRKFVSLNLFRPPSHWYSHFDGQFSQLVEIEITEGYSALCKNTSFLMNAPVLKRISLNYTRPPNKPLWSQITVLKFERIPAASALRCLLESPRLVEFYFIEVLEGAMDGGDSDQDNDEEPEEIPEMPDTLVLPHLHTLQWSFMLNRASNLFLHRIRLPSLRSLIWNQRREPLTGPLSPGIWSFFQNLSDAPLTTLCLSETFDLDATLAKHIYCKNPQIENIRLEYCNEETLRTALATLIPSQGEEVDGEQCLIKLKALDIKDCPEEDDYLMADVLPESFGNIVADLLIGRADSDLTSNLDIGLVFDYTKIEWSREAKEKLREFSASRDSAVVPLLVNGKQLSWE